MTDAQVALEAASRVHQKVEGQITASDYSVTSTADALLAWLRKNS